MQSHHALRIAGPKSEVLRQVREAAVLLLERHGHDQSDDRTDLRVAFVAGFMVAYFRCEPGELARRRRGNWNTTEGKQSDPVQYVIDIRVGEQVIGLGWRGDGPIRTDVHVRGPWEFELLKAAGLGILLPPGTIRPAPAVPESKSRWRPADALDHHSIFAMQASQPLTFTVVGYFKCYSGEIEPGDDLPAIREQLAEAYGASRTADGEAYAQGMPSSCFLLECRVGRRTREGQPPVGRPDFSFFIGSDDGLTVAASLLLKFDDELFRHGHSTSSHRSRRAA